jgi:predicted ferric reductase
VYTVYFLSIFHKRKIHQKDPLHFSLQSYSTDLFAAILASAYIYTVKGSRGKVSFDSQNDKYASQLSSDASPEAYL